MILPDEQYALDFATRLSFPRRIGSPGHEKAIDHLKKEFSTLGLDAIEENFRYKSLKGFKYFSRGLYLSLLFFTLYLLWSTPEVLWIAIPFYLVMIVYSYSFLYRLGNTLNGRQFAATGQKMLSSNPDAVEAKNLYSIIPPKKEVKDIVVLSAHYDSINLSMNPTPMIFYAIITQAGPVIIPIGLLIACFLGGIWLTIFQVLITLVAVASIAGFLFAFTIKHANESRGAVDNASGVAVAFGTTKFHKSLDHTLLILATWDAEEEGLKGSTYFAKQTLPKIAQKYQLPPERVHVIAFDGPGSNGKLGCSSSFAFPFIIHHNHGLTKGLKSAAKELDIPFMGGIWFYYASSDHAPFAVEGYDTTWFFSMSAVSNTVKDVPELLNASTLNNAIRMTLTYLEKLDHQRES